MNLAGSRQLHGSPWLGGSFCEQFINDQTTWTDHYIRLSNADINGSNSKP